MQERHTDFDFNEPAEVLVELAKTGDIDPWDIDIALATEKFLEHIDSLEKQDLRIPARTLLYASILLRMKSDLMEEDSRDEEPLDEPFPDYIIDDDYQMERKLPKPPVRRRMKRPVTLDELISELKKAEMVGRRKVLRERKAPDPVEEDVDISHEEGIEDRIKTLGPVISEMLNKKERVAFDEIEDDDKILNYISLLFMANRKQVWIEQEKLFDELYLRKHPG